MARTATHDGQQPTSVLEASNTDVVICTNGSGQVRRGPILVMVSMLGPNLS